MTAPPEPAAHSRSAWRAVTTRGRLTIVVAVAAAVLGGITDWREWSGIAAALAVLLVAAAGGHCPPARPGMSGRCEVDRFLLLPARIGGWLAPWRRLRLLLRFRLGRIDGLRGHQGVLRGGGTSCNTVATTWAAVSPLNSASGRIEMRCASTGSASALMSSGST